MGFRASLTLVALVVALSRGVDAEPPYAALPATPSLTATYRLRDGQEMPVFGLGVYVSKPGGETYTAVKWALELGYRMFDTAKIYGNEHSVGEAIRDSGIPREELWITTKLWDADHGYDSTIKACETSLKELGLDYLDLYLIHSPQQGKIVETWDAMLALKKRGLVKAVGVSNFDIAHLQALADHGRELPLVNQFEMHPLLYKERMGLLEQCKKLGILVQAYGSMFFGDKKWLADPAVQAVVAAHPSKTPAQVLLRWGFQMGFQLIPKSSKRHRLEENAGIFDFELLRDEMDRLSAMEGHLGAYWNPLKEPVDVGDVGRKDEL